MGKSAAARNRVGRMTNFYRGGHVNPTDMELLAGSGAVQVTPRVPISKATRAKVRKSANGRCVLCGLNRNRYGFLLIMELDHILSKNNGGADFEENLRLVCVECHEGLHPDRVKSYGYYPRTYRERALLILALSSQYGELSVRQYNRLRTAMKDDKKFVNLVNKLIMDIWKWDAANLEETSDHMDLKRDYSDNTTVSMDDFYFRMPEPLRDDVSEHILEVKTSQVLAFPPGPADLGNTPSVEVGL